MKLKCKEKLSLNEYSLGYYCGRSNDIKFKGHLTGAFTQKESRGKGHYESMIKFVCGFVIHPISGQQLDLEKMKLWISNSFFIGIITVFVIW